MKCIKTAKHNGNWHTCGYCHACRVNYTSMWTLRCLYELSEWDCASFVTLTYSDEFLPKDMSLDGEVLTKFWKLLRENLYKEYGYRKKIKYYSCGEYGDREKKYWSPGAKKPHGRPHYHAIIFGLDSYNDRDRQVLRDTWKYCEPWLFDKERGENSAMLPVCREDIAYTCGYVQKKLNGEMASDEYGKAKRPFSRSSQKLGLSFAENHRERLVSNGFTFLNGKKIGIPRYYREKFGVSQEELLSRKCNKTVADFEEENKILFELFKKDQIAKGIWNPSNLTMTSIRYERWFDNYEYSFSKIIERDYLQKQKIKGRYL